jgi:nucleoid DNA-binding protein
VLIYFWGTKRTLFLTEFVFKKDQCMNKKELVGALAEKTELMPNQIAQIIDVLLEIISKELEKGGQVSIAGFGTFGVKKRAERQGHNPFSGKLMTIPEKIVPVFKPASRLKEIVNKG